MISCKEPLKLNETQIYLVKELLDLQERLYLLKSETQFAFEIKDFDEYTRLVQRQLDVQESSLSIKKELGLNE